MKRIENFLYNDIVLDDCDDYEEIFIPEEECSKSFYTPKILGCTDNLENNIVDGPFMEE